MERTIASFIAPFTALGIAGILVISLGGCGDSQNAAAGSIDGTAEPLTLSQDLASSADGADDPEVVSQIAAQFERDMRDFSAMRERAEGPAAVEGSDPFPRRPHRSSRPAVEFTSPEGAEPVDGGHGAAAAEADGSGVDAGDLEHLLRIDPGDIAGDSGSIEVRMSEAMVNLRRELYKDAAYAGQPLRQYLTMAALTLIDPRRSIDPDAFPDLSPREREILRAYQDFFISLGREIHQAGDQAKLVDLIDQLRTALLEEPPLKIARAELCTRVEGFGSFQPFDKFVFLAGTPQEVVIYSEIENFKSLQNDRGEWVTDLWQELIIYNSADNVPVWHQQWLPAPDRSARKRNDFFISYLVTLPERLTVGQYTLKVRVRDEASGLVAETGIPFQIVADPTLTARMAQ